MINKYFVMESLFWGGVITFILFTLRSRSCFHSVISDLTGKQKRIGIFLVIAIVIAVCIFPMGLSPHYNGTISNWRNLYEVGTLLYVLRNRTSLSCFPSLSASHRYKPDDVSCHPAFCCSVYDRCLYSLLFSGEEIFYQTDMGHVLILICCGGGYERLVQCGGALYCTAITSGLCLEIWSIYFFTKAVWGGLEDGKSILCAFAGSILGALAFGCRPSVALANILVIPMLAEYLCQKKITPVLIRRLVFAASPYVVVAVLLMAYNYVRFDNPFEFGQTWQLTSADQSSYGDIGSRLDLINIGKGVLQNFISFVPLKEDFPYLSFNGVLINFPILLFLLVGLTREETRKKLREIHLYNFAAVLCFTPVLITIITVMESPWLLERYRMDLY